MTRRKAPAAQTAPANDAFPEEVVEPELPAPVIDLMAALVTSLEPAQAPAPAAPKPRAAPRRVSAEVVKAETKLLALERRRQDSLAHAETVWAAKRVALIESFPEDVGAALVAMGVLTKEEEDPQ